VENNAIYICLLELVVVAVDDGKVRENERMTCDDRSVLVVAGEVNGSLIVAWRWIGSDHEV